MLLLSLIAIMLVPVTILACIAIASLVLTAIGAALGLIFFVVKFLYEIIAKLLRQWKKKRSNDQNTENG